MKKHVLKVQPSNKRRQFLKLSGLAVLGSGLLIACDDSNDSPMMPPSSVFDLGTGDLGVLNYAYALEQLEADFYTKVVNNPYSGMSSVETTLFTDLYNHEVNHRDFFSAAISAAVGSNTDAKLPDLEFDYGDLDWSSRDQVLATAKALEDTGVAAYNGAGALISDATYLVIAGKIVSVEARHASAIRATISGSDDYTSFAGDDVIDANGLDLAKSPADIIAVASGFIKTEFTYKDQGVM
ncbi:ferritin-like domain-containing protein [Zhouia sp. PK063]|uniref:ferritin-like domain-containing protein n=1 Tax=Zhouia sp. PK063 TaxID=3373602 RepID=UPI0037BB6B42